MLIELEENGIAARPEQGIHVLYKGRTVGDFSADILVEDSIILERKAAGSLNEDHECRLINYLRATAIEVGLLMNFGR